jgi:hypothetical protein
VSGTWAQGLMRCFLGQEAAGGQAAESALGQMRPLLIA